MIKPRIRSAIAFTHDAVAIIAAWWLAYLFRFNFDIPDEYQQALLHMLLWAVPVQAGIFSFFGLYRGLWRYASLSDLKQIVVTVVLGAITVPSVLYTLELPELVPRAAIFLAPILLMLIMGGSRAVYRSWKEGRWYRLRDAERQSVIILGSGSTAASLVKELNSSRDWHVAGLLTDNSNKLGICLHGAKVLGMIDNLSAWVEKLSVRDVIIAMPSASQALRRHALSICTQAGISPMTVPSYVDLIGGRMTVSQIRHIELPDLLGRPPVILDVEGLHELLAGKTVLVTGAGGSIGSELCRQISAFKPNQLILLERNEYALYTVREEFRIAFPEVQMAYLIGDIRDEARLTQIFDQYQPSAVFHAAAYKHVPLMENANAWQAVQNNVLGTYILARTAMQFQAEKFVLISTDKAVNPVNVMGASKRLAEMVCQALQQDILESANKHNGTHFVIVRFGNVLGSTGSVIPKFKQQIEQGGPITVTHPDICRYFMSLQEAAQLVLQAGAMHNSEVNGGIFVLDMGEPVRIVDLAKDMIRLSGLNEEEIKIVFTGLRPGEKLFEELVGEDESTLPTPHDKLRITIQSHPPDKIWLDELLAWFAEQPALSDADVRIALEHWIPEYSSQIQDAVLDNQADSDLLCTSSAAS